ncbi:MAG: helix-turn-helix domain-containing protein [Candidatus Adlerbacteria bacterium]
MQKQLEDLGLSEKEAKVYAAALEIGAATADQLAKQSKIVRSTTYVQLESLMKKGLMSTYEEGKKTFFAPESPESLKRIFDLKRKELEIQEKELHEFLPELMQKFEGAGERPVVRFFDGKEGITAMRENILNLPKGTELKLIYCPDSWGEIYTEEELFSYAQKRADKGIHLKAVYSQKTGPFKPDDIVPHTERRFIPYERMSIRSDIYIYKDTVAIMGLRGKIFGIVVESKEITQSMETIFALLWGIGQEEQ